MMRDDSFNCHPRDIAAFAVRHVNEGAALVFVTATEGGTLRAPGLRMAVRADGATLGFVSNGCVEADLTAVAIEAIRNRRVIEISYGRGSGKIDISLPCGGRVDLAVVPLGGHNTASIEAMVSAGRYEGTLSVCLNGNLSWSPSSEVVPDARFRFPIRPKIRLVVAGTGMEALILCRLAMFADMEVDVISPDERTLSEAAILGLGIKKLNGLATPVSLGADPWTAVALLFHDHEWEMLLLVEALNGPSFYIGALGSRRAHAKRVESLLEIGCLQFQIARIKAPIGLVHQLREPNLLAASVLAEIADVFGERYASF
jgi:xanthine dehydrogenase accessory factor